MDFAETRYFWIIAVSLVGKILRDREMDGRAASVETDDMTHIRHIHGGREHNHIRAVLARKLPKAKISGPGTRIQHTFWSNYSDLTCDLTPNGGLVREIPLFQGNLGW